MKHDSWNCSPIWKIAAGTVRSPCLLTNASNIRFFANTKLLGEAGTSQSEPPSVMAASLVAGWETQRKLLRSSSSEEPHRCDGDGQNDQ